MTPLVMLLLGAAFVVGVNGLSHHWNRRRHAALREELRDATVYLELTDVSASASAKAFLSWSMNWYRGDLLVTDRAIALLPLAQGPFSMAQPPILVVRKGGRRGWAEGWGRSPWIAEGAPTRDRSRSGTPRVVVAATTRGVSWTLRVQTPDLEALEAALRRYLVGEEEEAEEESPRVGGYRDAARVRSGGSDSPAEDEGAPEPEPEFSDDFLVRDGETPGFGQSPFTEPIGHRGGIVCFESDASRPSLWSETEADIESLAGLPLGECHYGAGTFPVEPFVAFGPKSGPLTGGGVLELLRARGFRSEHIDDLDRTEIRAPGYRGYSLNDEVHTDPSGQHLFRRLDDDPDAIEEESLTEDAESAKAHDQLRALVEGPLWYVLLHEDGGTACPLVALFAVGRSRRSGHLIGVASQQVCHNLCD